MCIFGHFGPNIAIFCTFCPMPEIGISDHCWLIWCPVDGLAGGCGARAVSRKIPIYFIIFIIFVNSLDRPLGALRGLFDGFHINQTRRPATIIFSTHNVCSHTLKEMASRLYIFLIEKSNCLMTIKETGSFC